MLHWLVGNCELLGFAAQNWMLVMAGALALYVVVLLARQRRAHLS